MNVIDGLTSEDIRSRGEGVDQIPGKRKTLVRSLIPLIDPANNERYDDGARCAAAYLLGELRAVEAVPVLSGAPATEPGPAAVSEPNRYDAPVWSAVVKIGRPAVPAMIENVETSDHAVLRKKSMGVLYYVLGGKRHLLELLEKLRVRAKEPGVRERVVAAAPRPGHRSTTRSWDTRSRSIEA